MAICSLLGKVGKNRHWQQCSLLLPMFASLQKKHPMNVEERSAGPGYTHPVVVRDNVWICTGAKILPVGAIGENSVIGAGGIVTKDIPANSLAAGNSYRDNSK